MDKYKLMGPVYDTLSKLYSGNAINRCKLSMLRPDTITYSDVNVERGHACKILFAGAGHGTDALHAAKLGAEVTIVELSPTMQKNFKKKLQNEDNQASLKINCVPGDIMKFEDFSSYDIVVANFFLNVFERKKMELLLNHLSKHCKPGGQFIIGDFKASHGNLLGQVAQNIYWYTAVCSFFLITGNAVHKLYDYLPILEKLNFEILEQRSFPVAGKDLYHAIRAQKKS